MKYITLYIQSNKKLVRLASEIKMVRLAFDRKCSQSCPWNIVRLVFDINVIRLVSTNLHKLGFVAVS
jgi:hypothetical protein